ncbi:hypothetical protein E2C01_004003 [Portunus trituberculatus]|uniref:Uncharacterized protein n=1 Tax=Portunus trituberculatus TaxID=210409 RepID=A0A5B7CPD0_PORTR|nr:hypothetical protein [Portunus trituberculatus]
MSPVESESLASREKGEEEEGLFSPGKRHTPSDFFSFTNAQPALITKARQSTIRIIELKSYFPSPYAFSFPPSE